MVKLTIKTFTILIMFLITAYPVLAAYGDGLYGSGAYGVGEGVNECENNGGICIPIQDECSKGYIESDYACASENEKCCIAGQLPKLCSKCGKGPFDFCDRQECEAIKGCYFVKGTLYNTCKPCSGATCESYDGDRITCKENPCNLERCAWNEKFCTTLCNKDDIIKAIIRYFNNPTIDNLNKARSLFLSCLIYKK